MDKFSKDVANFAEKSRARIDGLKRAVAIELFKSVIYDTPVGNVAHWNISAAAKRRIKARGYVGGRLKGGWQASYGAPAFGPTMRDADGASVVAEMTSTIANAPADKPFILVNRLPYAGRIEYDGWSSKKAPQGMVRKNTRRIRNLINKELRNVKARIK